MLPSVFYNAYLCLLQSHLSDPLSLHQFNRGIEYCMVVCEVKWWLHTELYSNSLSHSGICSLLLYIDPPDENGKLQGFAYFKNCTFRNNSAEEFGAAIGVSYLHLGSTAENITLVEMHEYSTFISNDGGGGGTVSTILMPRSFTGSSQYKENWGRALVVCVW